MLSYLPIVTKLVRAEQILCPVCELLRTAQEAFSEPLYLQRQRFSSNEAVYAACWKSHQTSASVRPLLGVRRMPGTHLALYNVCQINAYISFKVVLCRPLFASPCWDLSETGELGSYFSELLFSKIHALISFFPNISHLSCFSMPLLFFSRTFSIEWVLEG